MKIAMLASNRKPIPSPKNLIFAPGIIIHELTEGLVKKGHEVTLFAPEGTKTSARLVTAGTRSLYEDFASEKDFAQKRADNLEKYLTMDNQYELLMASTAFEQIKKAKYDIIHSHKTIHEIYFSKLVDLPSVFTLHDNPLREMHYECDKMRLYKYAQSCYFISISKAQQKGLEFLNFASHVYNGINLDKYFFSRGDDNLLFAGRLDKAKGLDTALQICEKSGKKLIVAGDIVHSSEGYKQYENLKIKVKENQADYLGHINYEDMPKLYQKAKAFLFPISWPEAFGLVMVEAMACGTPVIAFDNGSVPEVIKDGQTGFICKPGDIGAMIKAVKKIYAMPHKEYQKMRLNCRKHVEENFSIEKMINGYEEIYKKIIKKWKKLNA